MGGVGPQATEYLYKKIISEAVKQYGVRENHEFPRVLIISEPVIDFISSKEHFSEARKQVLFAVQRLINGGATHLAIASNTVHLLAEEVAQLCQEHGVVFLSMLDAVAAYCKESGFASVGLLASPVTLQSSMYDTALMRRNLTVIKPNEQTYSELGCIIKKVIADTVSDTDIKTFQTVCTEVSKKADAVILGCTELPILAAHIHVEVPSIDTSSVLADVLLRNYYTSEKSTTTKEQQS